MRFLGIDIGSSFIKGAVLDLDELSLSHIERIPFPQPVSGLPPAFREFETAEVMVAVRQLIERLIALAPEVSGILMCSQLHGCVLTREDGSAASRLINWQDQRALQPMPGQVGSYFDQLQQLISVEERRQLGNEPIPGVPVSTLYWLTQTGSVPRHPVTVAALPYFVVANLCGDAPKTDLTHAYGHGALNIETLDWHHAVIGNLGLTDFSWPQIVAQGSVVGEWSHNGRTYPLFAPVGDYHCSQVGALLDDDELSINISTGSAVIQLAKGCETGPFQTRPWFDGCYLKTITHIPAGRALNALVRLLGEVAQLQGLSLRDPWEHLIRSAEQVPSTDLQVNPAFYFSSMGDRGSITNLCEENMTVGHLLRATFAGMADNYTKCAARIAPAHDWRQIVFSGGVALKTPLLRQLICERLGNNYRLAPTEEDTLFGLLVLALAFQSESGSVRQAMAHVRHLQPRPI